MKLMHLFALVISVSSCPWASAQVYSGAISASAGGTGRAAVDAGTAGFLNPAMLAHQRGRQVYTAWTQDVLAVSLSENMEESTIPSSFAYWQKKSELISNGVASSFAQQDLRLALAELIKNGWSVGLTAHYFQVKSTTKSWNQANLDLGIAVTPVANMGLALVLYDLGPTNKEIPEELQLTPKVGLGFHHIFKEYFRTRIDIVSGPGQNFAKSTVMLGFENYLNQWVIFRVGTQNNKFLNEDLLSLGIGFDLPKFRLNYAYQFVATNSKDQRHSVDLAVPF